MRPRDLMLGVLAAMLVVGAPAVYGALTHDACPQNDHDEGWPDVAAMGERAEGLEWAYAAEAVRLNRRTR